MLFIMSFGGLDDLVGAIVAGKLSYNWLRLEKSQWSSFKIQTRGFFKGDVGHELPKNVPLLGVYGFI
jgi:hypothetical protein